ncbi:MAG: TetR/AcrR family transcriptional regulator [Acidobacteria bacterium]|nr:TetR/AcrR family transcriptional regulator [Acidobacteriota bacterium]
MSGKREHIVQVASQLIHIKGFNNTSIDDILHQSGVKKGSFYFYFKSKEELGFAVIEHHMEQFRQDCLAPILESDCGPFDKLMRILDALEEEQTHTNCKGGCPFGNMALELSDMHEGFRVRLQEIFQGMTDLFYQLLSEASGEPYDGADLREVSQLIVATIEGGIMLSKVHKSILPMQECVRQLKNYLRMLSRAPAAAAGESSLERGTVQ